eukprot:RCo044175
MVVLRSSLERPCAFCPVTVTWPGQTPGKWDYVELTGGPDFDRYWEWVEGKSQFHATVGPPGQYTVKYFSEGGYLTPGTLQCSLVVNAVNPFRSLEVPGSVGAASPVSVGYVLDFGDTPSRPLFVVLAKEDVILHAVSTSGGLRGRVQLPAPRVEGPCRVAIQGTMDRCSALGSQGVLVTMSGEARPELSFVETQSRGTQALAFPKAALAAPDAPLRVKFRLPLFVDGDALWFTEGPEIPLPIPRGPSYRVGARSGEIEVRAPECPGVYSLVYATPFRNGAVRVGVTRVEVFVSAMAMSRETSVTEALPLAPRSFPAVVEQPCPSDQCSSASSEALLCKVCLSSAVSVMLSPCRHVALCPQCA